MITQKYVSRLFSQDVFMISLVIYQLVYFILLIKSAEGSSRFSLDCNLLLEIILETIRLI